MYIINRKLGRRHVSIHCWKIINSVFLENLKVCARLTEKKKNMDSNCHCSLRFYANYRREGSKGEETEPLGSQRWHVIGGSLPDCYIAHLYCSFVCSYGWMIYRVYAYLVAVRQVLGRHVRRLHPSQDIRSDQRDDPPGLGRLGSRLLLPTLRMEGSWLAPEDPVPAVSHQSGRRLSGELIRDDNISPS